MSAAPVWIPALLALPVPQAPPVPQDGPAPWAAHIEPASDEAERACAALGLPAGFEAELFASEPRLANPVCLYADEHGSVWVAETFRHHEGVTDMRDHEDWLDEELALRTVGERVALLAKHEGPDLAAWKRASERVRWLADVDGDGRADVDTVFAEGFDAPEAGIGAGLLVHGGLVYYACIPDLWRLADVDGNRRADARERLSTGYGVNIALLGHDLHGLRIGPDGKLYFSCGDRGFHVETERGTLAHAHTGAVLRCDLDGSSLEIFATGLRNPQELVFDEYGNLWTGDNNSDGGDQARWVQVVEGSDSGWRYAYQWLTEPVLRGPWNDECLWEPAHAGQAAYILPPVANLASGPSGLCYDPGSGLPPELAGHFFLCDFRGDPAHSAILAFTVVPRGAGFELGPVQRFLTNALPTDADFGPDGSLYVCDWVAGWNKTGKGRVYRISAPDHLQLETARLLDQGAGERSESELAELLGHADQRVRQMAQFELVRRAAGETLAAAAGALGSERLARLARLHALWGLGMLGDERVLAHARDGDAEVRAQVCRILGGRDAFDAEQRGALLAGLADEAPRVRLYAALALRKAAGPGGARGGDVAPLVELLRRDGGDPVLRHAAVMGLLGQARPDELVALAADASRDVRLGAVVALRRMVDAGVATFLDDAEPLVVLEAARAIYDEPIDAALDELAALIARPGPFEHALGRRVVNASYRRHDRGAAQALLDFAQRADELPELRVEALARLADWDAPPGRDPLTGVWRPLPAPRDGVAELLAESFVPELAARAPDAVRRAWIELLEREPGARGAQALFEAVWLDAAAAESLRVRALEALAAGGAPPSELLERALSDPASAVRAAALALASEADPEQAFPWIEAAATRGERAERRAAYALLARSPLDRAAALLASELEALEAGRVPSEVILELVAAAAERGGERLSGLLARRAASRADAALAPYLDGLFGGDPAAGERLFRERAELACLRCHVTSGEGAASERPAIGPSLVELGLRSTRLDVLASIVDPNRSVAAGLRSTLFFLDDGTRVEGQVQVESAEEIRVLDADGTAHVLDPARVETRRAGLSAMPEGLAQHLTPEEMRDLLEFLGRL